jgi:hypothetical protein
MVIIDLNHVSWGDIPELKGRKLLDSVPDIIVVEIMRAGVRRTYLG